jgi:hexosaminidase
MTFKICVSSRYFILWALPWILILFGFDIKSLPETDKNLGIIPAPSEIRTDNVPGLLKHLNIYLDDEYQNAYLDSLMMRVPGVSKVQDMAMSNVFIQHVQDMHKDAYHLVVGKNKIDIEISSAHGLQHALVSLVQMIIYSGFPLPLAEIKDQPRFSYRGMHLDVCRHFFGVEDIKKYLDYMAYYKYNHFHWHLTEDQGWRIEIKKYPRLQEVAAYRNETLVGHYNDMPHRFDGIKYGGFYTQEEVREIVAYARDRHIVVIPEIEMPGHSLAALAAYPELGCEPQKNYEVATKWGVFKDVYCPTETTFKFLQGVIDEVITLFPGPYIHIGGDECPKEAWKNSRFCQELIAKEGLHDENGLQSYFIRRMEKYILSKGKTIIGWDEILEGGLAPHATVMSWRGVKGGLEAARLGHDVIMTPGSHCYFDHYQSESHTEPLAIGGLTTLEKVYKWNPVPESLEQDKQKYILGGQANVWTEYIRTYPEVEYMAYARGMAMAEVLWTGRKDYRDFIVRFKKHCDDWQKKGTQMAFHVYDLKPQIMAGTGQPVTLKFETLDGADISFSYAGEEFQKWDTSRFFQIEKSGMFTFVQGSQHRQGTPLHLNFDLHKGTQATLMLATSPTPPYTGQGSGSLVNGILGSDIKYGGSEWLGFSGKDCEGILDFGEVMELNEIQFRFFKGEGQWIYLPSRLEIWMSDDGQNYRKWTETDNIKTDEKVAVTTFVNLKMNTRFVKFYIRNFGKIPAGRQGAGHGAWLFVDEIMVR